MYLIYFKWWTVSDFGTYEKKNIWHITRRIIFFNSFFCTAIPCEMRYITDLLKKTQTKQMYFNGPDSVIDGVLAFHT